MEFWYFFRKFRISGQLTKLRHIFDCRKYPEFSVTPGKKINLDPITAHVHYFTGANPQFVSIFQAQVKFAAENTNVTEYVEKAWCVPIAIGAKDVPWGPLNAFKIANVFGLSLKKFKNLQNMKVPDRELPLLVLILLYLKLVS